MQSYKTLDILEDFVYYQVKDNLSRFKEAVGKSVFSLTRENDSNKTIINKQHAFFIKYIYFYITSCYHNNIVHKTAQSNPQNI